jgi:hypothetical protein
LCAAAGFRPPLPLDQFQFDKPQQVADMVDTLGGALTSGGDTVGLCRRAWLLAGLRRL